LTGKDLEILLSLVTKANLLLRKVNQYWCNYRTKIFS